MKKSMIHTLRHSIGVSGSLILSSILLSLPAASKDVYPLEAHIANIVNEYNKIHWQNADSLSQVLQHIKSYPFDRRHYLSPGISYLQCNKDSISFTLDSNYYYLQGPNCYVQYPLRKTPCQLVTQQPDTLCWNRTAQLNTPNVCFDSKGNVLYSANKELDKTCHRIRQEIRNNDNRLPTEKIWFPLEINREDSVIRQYCTGEPWSSCYYDSIHRQLIRIFQRHPKVYTIRFCVWV